MCNRDYEASDLYVGVRIDDMLSLEGWSAAAAVARAVVL